MCVCVWIGNGNKWATLSQLLKGISKWTPRTFCHIRLLIWIPYCHLVLDYKRESQLEILHHSQIWVSTLSLFALLSLVLSNKSRYFLPSTLPNSKMHSQSVILLLLVTLACIGVIFATELGDVFRCNFGNVFPQKGALLTTFLLLYSTANNVQAQSSQASSSQPESSELLAANDYHKWKRGVSFSLYFVPTLFHCSIFLLDKFGPKST